MNAQEERNESLRGSLLAWRDEKLVDAATAQELRTQLATPWRSYNLLVQAVFFVLTAVGLLAFFLLFGGERPAGIIVGVVALGLAEMLIRGARWWRTGVESALWLGGVLALISTLPHSGTPEAMLVLAAGAAFAGARLRNPLFGGLAAGLIVEYCERRFDLGVVGALVIAGAALVLLMRTWKRPSTEWLWIVLLVATPLVGISDADPEWRRVTILLYAILGVACLAAAIAKRHHAMFLASGVGFAIAAYEISRDLAISLELKLAADGAFLLIGSYVVSRALRSHTRGFVVTPAKLTAVDDMIEIAGALAAADHAHHAQSPAEAAPAEPARAEGDGGFGGAGATGSY
jgi:hypothetical protein